MSEPVFDVVRGSTPLLVSIPHDGRLVPDTISARLSAAGRALPDTDWHVAQLYAFATDLGASVITARYSRYVVDLNRPPDDAALYGKGQSTGICPDRTFAGEPIYADGTPVGQDEERERIAAYWQPYHAQLAEMLHAIRQEFGYALLWDAHSIVSEAPLLFDGELPVLNVGTWGGRSCAADIGKALAGVLTDAPQTSVINGRFTGGHITRHYGDPARDVHAVQLELAQRSYMDEKTMRYDETSSAQLVPVLEQLLRAYLEAARARYARYDYARREHE
ncbi:MAG: N-formylglutamate deformylase [Woeseiaceae bacterium]|nr:N-formylglutamate deformylase [Woeseiaceae bacterium]